MIAAFEGYFRADDALHLQRVGKLGEAHRPAEVIVVGEGQGTVAELFGPQQQFLQRRGAVVERVIAVAVKLGIHRIKIPITKIQIPRKFQIPNHNLKTSGI